MARGNRLMLRPDLQSLIPGVIVSCCSCLLVACGAAHAGDKIEFDRDIRPILAENCFPCHGPDENKRKAKLRLDRSEDALKTLPNGEIAIVPGQPSQSKVIERIRSKDSDELMPPVKSGKKLSAQNIEWITEWIKQGAQWQNHWAFVPPSKPPFPELKKKRWARNPIDSFVLARLEQEGLTPSAYAPRSFLPRRLCFDITRLP